MQAKKFDDKLVGECTKNVGEVRLAKITLAEDENEHNKLLQTLHCVILNKF